MDMTEEDLVQVESIPKPGYKERIISRIRAVYSIDDEIAILRQRDTKPEEFEASFRYLINVSKAVGAKVIFTKPEAYDDFKIRVI